MSTILNEHKYALEILDKHIIGNKPSETLSILARYYCHKEHKKSKEIYNLLNSHMEKYYPNYNENNWYITLEKQVKKSKKYPLIEINSIPITEEEIKIIHNLNSPRKERVLFVLLACAKFANMRNSKNNNWVNKAGSEIFRMARVQINTKDQNLMFYEFKTMGLISVSKKVNNLNTRVDYINDDSPIVIYLNDFKELGYEYINYFNPEKFIRCLDCGVLVRKSKNATKACRCKECQKLTDYEPNPIVKVKCVDCGKVFSTTSLASKTYRCNDCQKLANYFPIVTKTITCIDCGKPVEVDARNMTKKRCDECYKEYRREYKAKKELERYYKNKS